MSKNLLTLLFDLYIGIALGLLAFALGYDPSGFKWWVVIVVGMPLIFGLRIETDLDKD